METLVGIIGGITLLIGGGYTVIYGSVAVARMLGWSEFFIGVVLIGFGTSSPELFASVGAAWHGSAGLAFGNVVGSNISNLLLILAMTAIITPITVSDQIAKKDAPFLLLLTGVFVLTSLLPLSRLIALGYIALIAGYIYHSHQSEQAPAETTAEQKPAFNKQSLLIHLAIAIGGVAMLVFGADMLVAAASQMARGVGVSETAIGLTIVAIGTSLPEFVSSVSAARKGKHGLALGNIIGSNVYNLFGILGVTGLVAPTTVPGDIRWIHNPIMLIATAFVVYVMYSKQVLDKKTGKQLVGAYCAYTVFLFLIS